MTKADPLHAQLTAAFQSQIDEAYLKRIQMLVPTGWEVIGVRVPDIRATVKVLKKENPAVALDDVLELIDFGFREQSRELALSGIFWLTTMKRELDLALWPLVDRWVEQLTDWEMCDQLATGVAAVIVSRDLILVDDLVYWARSSNQWRRRFAAATATALNQKGRAHVPETLRICAELMSEETPIVCKAVGWALREATKHDETAVFEFLLSWQAQANPRIIREGAAKLAAEKRAKL